jgi:hypothetical protein
MSRASSSGFLQQQQPTPAWTTLAAAAAAAAKEGEQQQQQQQQAGAAGDSNSGAGLVAGPAAADFVRKDIPHMPDAPLSHLKRLNELMKGLVEQVGGGWGNCLCAYLGGGGGSAATIKKANYVSGL